MRFWDAVASRWTLQPPLSPSSEDIRWFESRARPSALLLGLTVGVATMRWPAETKLTVIDWSENVFRHMWPRQGLPDGAVRVRGDWRELPLAARSFDFVAGDGCYSAFASSDEADALNAEVERVLRPDGRFCMRCFALPSRPKPLEELFAQLRDGAFENRALFRWLVIMAAHGGRPDGVGLTDVYEVWRRHFPDLQALRSLGWDEASVRQIDHYRNHAVRYSFHTIEQLKALCERRFTAVEVEVPPGEFGACFPRLSMRALARQ